MRDTTLRTGKRIYGYSGTNSPNWKGATAVRPNDVFADILRNNRPKLQGAISRRLKNGYPRP